MPETTNLSDVAAQLQDMGYNHLTASSGHISGVVYGLDLSDAPRSVPEGEDTGPFSTLDNPEQHIPEDIMTVAEENGLDTTVLGHGPSRLHIHIS